jgi:hypothetical protein
MTRVFLTYDLVRAGADAPARPDHPALYAAMLDQVAWADAHGFGGVQFGEHHGASNGYLSAPIVAAAAAAGRTRRLEIRIAALILPLHDPGRAAGGASLPPGSRGPCIPDLPLIRAPLAEAGRPRTPATKRTCPRCRTPATPRAERRRKAASRVGARPHDAPPIVLADEPTAALDSVNAQMVSDVLTTYASETNAIVVAVSHDRRLIEACTEEVSLSLR